jgi:cytochrome o ubiquinol oxidase operon protein cyoD
LLRFVFLWFPQENHTQVEDVMSQTQIIIKSYLIGFLLAVVLTAIPFWLVMGNILGDTLRTSIVIMAFAAVQIVVHMIYFLHMNTKSEGGWTFLALAFTLTLVVITLTGSIWVMYHMDQNMMPMTPHEALTRP